MTLYQMASMLAGQFALVLMHNGAIQRGSLLVVPHDGGVPAGVYVNPKDVPEEFGGALRNAGDK